MNDHLTVATFGTGNVFEDLGLADAPVLLAKAELVQGLERALQERGHSLEEAACQLDLSATQLDRLLRGLTEDISLDWLVHALDTLGYTVVIAIESKLTPTDPPRLCQSTLQVGTSDLRHP